MEYFYITASDFVSLIYKIVLGRTPDENGHHFYTSKLKAGFSRTRLIMDLVTSSEAIKNKEKFVDISDAITYYRKFCSRFPSTFYTKKFENRFSSKISFWLSEQADQITREKYNLLYINDAINNLEKIYWDHEFKRVMASAILETLAHNKSNSITKSEYQLTRLDYPIRFSIVINTLNRAHTIESTLKALSYLRYQYFEVIIVNGPSTDGTNDILENYKNIYKIGSCPEANLSMSRNIGIAMAAGDVVCFIDDDAIPEPNWLCTLADTYMSNPLAASVGGYIRNNSGYEYQCKAIVCDRFGDSYGFDTPEAAIASISDNKDRYISFTGTNCSFRRDALINIGGFNEEFAYFLDETDVEIRLHDKGFLAFYSPKSEIHHKYASSHLRDQDRIPKSIYISVRSKVYFIIKHSLSRSWLDGIFDYILKYRSELRSAYNWYYDNAKIDLTHRNKLHAEVDSGIHDGLFDAFSGKEFFMKSDFIKDLYSEYIQAPQRLSSGSRLQLCFFAIDYPPHGMGGISKWTKELAEGIANLGHEVTVITNSVNNFHVVDFENNTWVHRVPIRHHSNRDDLLIEELPNSIKDVCYSFYDELVRVDKIRGISVVSSPIWDVPGAAVLVSRKFPIVVSLHTTYKLALPFKPDWHKNTEYLENHVNKIIDYEERFINDANKILANSNAIIRDIKKNYANVNISENNIFTVPHGIAPRRNRKKYPDDSLIRILFVGRCEARKGIDILLDVIPTLCENYRNIEFHIVGDSDIDFSGGGPIIKHFLSTNLNANWLPRFIVHGILSDEQLDSLYECADIFVAPSRYESFGLIYIEAMRYGIPCIGCNIGGVPEVINNGVDGILLDECTHFELKLALESLIDDSELRNNLGAEALKSVSNKFSISLMVENCIHAYRSAIENFIT